MERSNTAVVTVIQMVFSLVFASALPGLYGPTVSAPRGEAFLSNHSCLVDHSTANELSVCSGEIRNVNRTSFFYNDNITECPRYPTSGFRHCAHRTKLSANDQFLVKSLEGKIIPVNASHFSIRVQWSWYEYDYNRSEGKLQGYELRIQRGETTIGCLCIREPSLRTIDLGLDSEFEYKSSKNLKMTFEISTFPYDGSWSRNAFAHTSTIDWPDICSGSPVCLFSLPTAPKILKAVSVTVEKSSREVELSWTKPDSHVEMYYIQLFNDTVNETVTFFVNGSNNVNISGLQSNIAWSVRIQSYSSCSGLASYYSGASEIISCGEWSSPVHVTEELPQPSSSSLPLSTVVVSLHYYPSILVIIILFATAFLLAPIVTIIIYIRFRRGSNTIDRSTTIIIEPPVIPMITAFESKPPKVDVLVLYSLSTPTQQKVEIEKYIVGYLRQQNFKVISCNDHTEKTIMQWVEENARLASVIFIVCNEQFFLDWKMNKRPQLVNSLDMIVNSAVGQNSSRKYATVLLQPGDEKNIPDNLYFKGMKSFVMGCRATPEEKATFSGFIKLTVAMR